MSISKKVLTLLVMMAALALAVAGCGGDDSNGDGGDDATVASSEVSVFCEGECAKALEITDAAKEAQCKVGVSWSDTSFPYGAAAISKSEEAAKQFPNMELITTDGRGDATTQTSQVDDLIARGIDVLVLSPIDAKALAPAAKRAEAAGIKVIASDRSVDAPVVTYVGADNVEAGKVAGDWIVEDSGGEASVVELQGSLGASPTIDRNKGFMDALSAASGIEVVASESADYARDEGLRVMENLLQRFGSGDIDYVFAHNDEMALGAIQAIREADRSDEIKVIGIDGQESALDAIEAGQYAATVIYPLPVPEHIVAAAKICAGEDLPKRIKPSAPLVTEDNVADYKGTTF